MAVSTTTLLVLIVLVSVAMADISTSQVIKAKVRCLDCNGKVDISGMKVVVKCEKVKELGVGSTEEDGSFEIQMNIPKQKIGNNKCVARLVGGPKKVYGRRDSVVSNLIVTTPNTFTTSNQLSVYTSCPFGHEKCESLSSSKTIDLPLPPQWGFAPSSLYFPFFPIIGIP